MTQKQAIQLFEERKVRTVWDDETEKWYFAIGVNSNSDLKRREMKP